MNEIQAQQWLATHGWWEGSSGEKLRHFVALVLEEADRQNLISAGSRDHIWARHIVDSAQLVKIAEQSAASPGIWADLGAGAGFPGVVVACLRNAPVRLIEMRPLRVSFLQRCAKELDLPHLEVFSGKVEKARNEVPASVISARAYAPLDRLLKSAHHLADQNTLWLLPKGRSGEKELANVRSDWQAVFHVERSITDPESVIVTIRDLKQRTTAARSTGGQRSHTRVAKPAR